MVGILGFIHPVDSQQTPSGFPVDYQQTTSGLQADSQQTPSRLSADSRRTPSELLVDSQRTPNSKQTPIRSDLESSLGELFWRANLESQLK